MRLKKVTYSLGQACTHSLSHKRFQPFSHFLFYSICGFISILVPSHNDAGFCVIRPVELLRSNRNVKVYITQCLISCVNIQYEPFVSLYMAAHFHQMKIFLKCLSRRFI